MATAGLKGDHQSFAWCALYAAQFSEVLGALAQQDEQPELILLTYKVCAVLSIQVLPCRVCNCHLKYAVLSEALHE
jgi:hypothetical protein